MNRAGHVVRTYWLDALTVLAALESTLEVVLRQSSPQAPQTTLWLTVPGTAVIVLPLLGRRRFPFAAPASVWLIGTVFSFVEGRLVVFTAGVYIAGMAAAYLLGNLEDDTRARLGLVVVVGAAAIIVYNNPSRTTGSLVFTPLVFALGWLAGYALRGREQRAEAAEARASQAEREREASARIAVAEERARIARELHDVVAHSMSVMVLQVGAVRHKLPSGLAAEADALLCVEQAGREALAEMRRLLGAMRAEQDGAELAPQPSLDRLESLAAEVGRAGLPVHLHVEGVPVALPPAISLSAFRIVQEGLTNALKHARASRADVTVRYGPGELRIGVRNDGSAVASGDGHGHGLVGIRERVKIYGGEMHAGPGTDGGFVLSARLPIEGGT